jgi:hypothetical protein
MTWMSYQVVREQFGVAASLTEYLTQFPQIALKVMVAWAFNGWGKMPVLQKMWML